MRECFSLRGSAHRPEQARTAPVPAPFQAEPLLETKLLRITWTGHSGLPHRDPAEEQWGGYDMVFTETGRWQYRDRLGRFDIDSDRVVLGAPRQLYGCRHFEDVPTDSCLDVRFQDAALRDSPFPRADRGFPASAIRITPRLRMLKESMKRMIRKGAEDLRLDSAGQDMLAELGRVFRRDSVLSPLPVRRRHKDSAQAAKEFIERHFAEEMRLQDLASAVGLSPFHFSRLFKEHAGRSPYRYLRDIRLNKAAQFLRRTRRPVTDVAYDVGFRNLSLFINSFKSRFGRSPSEFRRSPSPSSTG